MIKRCLIESGDFLYDKPLIYTAFNHNIKNLKKIISDNNKDFFADISKNTFSMIQFPFRVAFDLWISDKCNRYNENKRHKDPYTRVYSNFWKNLLLNPEEALD